MKRLIRYALTGVTFAVLAACGGGSSPPADASDSIAPLAAAGKASVADRLAVPGGAVQSTLDARLARAKGPTDVWVTLTDDSVAAYRAGQLAALGLDMQSRPLANGDRARILSAPEQAQRVALNGHRAALLAQQDSLMSQLSGMGAQELGRVHVAHNAVAVRVDASSLDSISKLSGVLKVRPVIHYALDLSETVPYVGGKAVQDSGRTGAGVKVAVLDSGIDYTHKNLGGAGTAAAYAAAYGAGNADPKNTTLDGLFPTAKVVAGFDFVGETWTPTSGTRTEDPDPIDFEGHGTHVADIIAGNDGGTHRGMAPGAKLVAVKVCSAVSSSCNGVALLKGMDYAIDPNGDGDTSDAVDVINMSLGSSYGQIEDDLTQAASNAVKLGVVVVVSAGNSADRPYITGSPSTGLGVISVAQTQVPSAVAIALKVNSPAGIARTISNTATVDFGPITGGFTGDVVLASSTAGATNNLACVALPAGSLAGKVVLIDRGSCAVSIKVDFAAKAGATGVLIANNAGGDPPTFSFGGPTPFTPAQTLVITQADGALIKANIAGPVNVTVSPSVATALVGSIVASSSRGPAYSTQHIKPEIGAPGASLSAEAGTGTEQTVFGGTSGAAPMVAGAVALLVEAFPNRSPDRIKAMLMNSAETNVFTTKTAAVPQLAPITRIGAGELRVNKAIALTSLAWNRAQKSASLSFGALEVDRSITTYDQRLRVENHSDSSKTFTVTPSFRYAADEASGAVKMVIDTEVEVPAHGYKNLDVRLLIDPDKLPRWPDFGPAISGNGAALNGPEYDGYVTLTAGAERLSVPWHVLPRRAAATEVQWLTKRGPNLSIYVNNVGHEDGLFDLFSLTGTSPKLPRSELPKPGDNFAVIDLRAVGVRYLPAAVFGADYLEFAINTHGRRAHPNYPAEFDVTIDTNGDGVNDYVVFNAESGGFALTGQNVVFVGKLKPDGSADGAATAVFFGDADLNSANMIFTVPMYTGSAAVPPGSVRVAPGATIKFSVRAFDNYFTGAETDAIVDMLFTPGAARFNPVDGPYGLVETKKGGKVAISQANVPNTRSSESGLLILHRRNAKQEADILRAN